MSNWDKVIKPIVVLCVICVVITGALAATNTATAAKIAADKAAAENAARTELLPEANGAFSPVEGVTVENVSGVYSADNGAGWVITSSSKGYGGTMTVMVAFSPDKTIKQIKVTEQGETKGIGSKVADTPSYWERYQGQPAAGELKINKDGGSIDAENGATISSRALAKAVSSAVEAYNVVNP